MKKYTYLLAAITISLIMSSCQKTYTCECKAFTPTGDITKYEFKMSKKKAQKKCDLLGSKDIVDGPHCELK
jgi:hypothetical protein